jgi:type I restriction enzyme S subunit
MTNWPSRRLGDITVSLNHKRVPVSALQRAKRKGKFPYYGASGIVDWVDDYLFDQTCLLISEDGENLRTRNTPIAFKAHGKYWVNNHAHILDEKESGILDFLEHAFRELDISGYITGAVQPKLNKRSLESIELPIPELEERLDINLVLGALDDKIELNRQMNETLEAMARALFKDWFVDFGPTHRKAAGITDPVKILGGAIPSPQKATPIADLFPDTFGEDGLPVGWKEGRLSDWASVVTKTVKPNEVDPKTNYIGLEHMPRRSIALGQWETAAKVTSNKSAFERGQILFGKLRPYFHKVGIAPIDGICSTDIVVVDGLSPELRSFVITLMSTEDFISYTNQSSSGTKMPRTSWKLMREYPIVRANKEAVSTFCELVQPMHKKIVHSLIENQTLAEMRDLLLPKLMSGEICLKDVELVE